MFFSKQNKFFWERLEILQTVNKWTFSLVFTYLSPLIWSYKAMSLMSDLFYSVTISIWSFFYLLGFLFLFYFWWSRINYYCIISINLAKSSSWFLLKFMAKIKLSVESYQFWVSTSYIYFAVFYISWVSKPYMTLLQSFSIYMMLFLRW